MNSSVRARDTLQRQPSGEAAEFGPMPSCHSEKLPSPGVNGLYAQVPRRHIPPLQQILSR